MLNSTHTGKNLRRINTKQDEPNPKTLPLEKVVEQIDSKVLAYYLEQVSLFLKNSKKDLLFPKLSPYLDTFLVRFISNVQSMEDLLDSFDWNSRSFAENIIDSLIENEKVYKLTYSYENSRIESDILVYKKVYLEEKKNLEKGSKQYVPKNSDALYSSQNDSTKPQDKQEAPRKDLSWVKATLKFIKDDTHTLLQYPTMSYSQADVVYSVVKQQCKDITHLGPLCEELLDAIKVMNATMELKTSFLYLNSKDVQLSIEKCPLKNKGVKCKLQPTVKNNSKVQEKGQEKTKNPMTSGPQQEESSWNAVVIKKKPKQLPNPPDQSPEQLPNPPDQSPKQLPNLPGQSSKQLPNLPDQSPEQLPNLPGQLSKQLPNLPGQSPKQLPNLPGQSPKQLPNLPGQSPKQLPNLPGQSPKQLPNLPGQSPKQVPNLPGQSPKQLPNPPGQSPKQLPNPDQSRKAKRVKTRLEARKARRQPTDGRRPREAAEGTAKPHDAPNSDALTPHVDNSPTEEEVAPKEAPSVASKPAATNTSEQRQATDGSRPREAAEGTAKPHDAPNSDALTPQVDNSPTEEKVAPKEASFVALKSAAANAPDRRKRVRRGNRGKGNTATPANPLKRNRPDDSFTPGEGKRRKPNPTTTSSIAYADALKSDFSVAIMMEPYHDLTKEQAEVIKRQVDGLLDDELFAPSSSSHPYVAPAFKANAFYSDGVLKFWCKDDFSLQWLHRTTAKIDSPRPGTKLVVKRQREIPKRVKTGLLVPQFGPDDTLDRVRQRLTCQNTHLNVSSWAVYHAEEQEDKQCLFLVLGVPEEDAEKLKASERRVYYKLGNIYARFLDNTSMPLPHPNVPGEATSDLGSGTSHHTAQSNPPQQGWHD